MVASLKFLADLAQRQVGQAADEVHGHLTGGGGFLEPLLAAQHPLFNIIVFADLGNDEIGGGHELIVALEHVAHGAGGVLLVDVGAQQLAVGEDLFHRALDLTDVGRHILCNVGADGIGQGGAQLGGLVFDDGHAGLVVRRLNVRQQTPLEPGLEALLQRRHFLGRTVGGQHDLAAGFVEGVEGMEEFLLGLLLAGDKLHIVHQQNVRVAVFVVELQLLALTDGLNQGVGKIIALDVHDFGAGVVLADAVGDGVDQMGLAEAAVAVDQ